MDKKPEEQERIFFQISGWIYPDGPYLLKAQPLKKKKKEDYSLFFFAVLPNFWKQNSKHLAARNIIVATHDSRKPVTSREWYWYQVRLWMAVQTCLAPLWCMQTHSRKLFDPGTSKADHGKFLIIHSIFFITKIEYINTNLNNLLRM